MRLPGTRNLQGGGAPGRFCRVLACDLHAPGVARPRIVGDQVLRAEERPSRGRNGRRAHDGAFAALALGDWFALLEPDRPISRYGYARCPTSRSRR